MINMSHMDKELNTFPKHTSSSPIFSEVRGVDRRLSFCPFSVGHCVVCSSSIYGF